MRHIQTCIENLQRIAEQAPRVHCITNAVAMNYTANLLLSVGALPSMTLAPEEISDFVACADALCINLGTLDPTRRQAIYLALQTAHEYKQRWVLDPVLVDVSVTRCRYAQELLEHRPSLIRANANEIAALVGGGEHAAERLARSSGAVIAQSGACDLITDGKRSIRIENGHPWMARVTALGCAGSALAAAFLALGEQAFAAAVQSLLALGVAGEMAAEQATGPGSFQLLLLDKLYRLDHQNLNIRGRVYE